MTIKDMHYDFKIKANKIDSQQYRNLLVPEIDWLLNEAEGLIIKIISNPRLRSGLGFEINQRSIDDIKNIVKEDVVLFLANGVAALPSDYRHYVKGHCTISKGSCTKQKAKLTVRQHDDDFQWSPFSRSSFLWREVNCTFSESGIKVYEEDFTVNNLNITYVRKTMFMHNAEDFRVGGYRTPSGQILVGTSDCELNEYLHSEVVDLAVMIASGSIQSSNYSIAQNKLKLLNLT